MFKFNPIPEEELNNNSWQNIQEEVVSFKISECQTDDVSGSMKITLQIKDNKGNSGRWYDNFSINTQWKTLQLLKAIGRVDWYKSGKIEPSMLIGLDGECEMKYKEYKGKTSLQVNRYIERHVSESFNSTDNNSWEDDDVPF